MRGTAWPDLSLCPSRFERPACAYRDFRFRCVGAVVAIRAKVGAIESGERRCPFRIAWHREQTSFALAIPLPGH
jgi:hypothetical protein